MSNEIMWLNCLGIVLEYLSFWFAAPELLGEERLSALENSLEQILQAQKEVVLPRRTFWLRVGNRIIWGPRKVFQLRVVSLVAALIVAVLLPVLVLMKGAAMSPGRSMIALVAGLFLIVTLVMLMEHAVPLVLGPLADDSRLRRRVLMLGALLFTLAFAFQLTAAFGEH